MEAKRILFLCSTPHARRLGACYSLVRFPPSAEPPSAHEESVDNVHLPRPGSCPSLGEDQLLLCCMPWMLVTWREGTQDTFGPDQCFPPKEESYPIKIFKQVYVCTGYHCNDVRKRLFPSIGDQLMIVAHEHTGAGKENWVVSSLRCFVNLTNIY